MNNFSVYIQSFTKAQKAREFLMRHGVQSIIERTHRRGQGCGFLIRIAGGNANREKVCALLREIGVNCDIS